MSSSLEDIKTIDLEEWLTLATAPSPTKLKLGQSPNMQNVWVDEKPGSVITAPGLVAVGTLPSGSPATFCIDYFKASSGTHLFVVSDNRNVWTTTDFQTFTYIMGPTTNALNSGFQVRGAIIRDKLWITNGSDAIKVFDGTNVSSLDDAAYPRARYIAYHDERVWLYHTSSNRSAVYFSSLTDASGTLLQPDVVGAWNMTNNFLQISEGDADIGTAMMIYRGYLFLFKQYSIWRLVGYDEYTYSRVKTRASTGTRFNESLQILDNLIHLIGVDGIYVFDGEESERISDLIDPATASQTAFGFNQLQQPNTNNQFWETTQTIDWNAGTVPADISVNNQIALQAADDTQANFQAGATQTNLDLTSSPGNILLSHTSSGVSSTDIISGLQATINASQNVSFVGALSFITDGNQSNAVGVQAGGSGSAPFIDYKIILSSTMYVSRIIIRGLSCSLNSNFRLLDQNGNQINIISVSGGTIVGGAIIFPASSNTTYTIGVTPTSVSALILRFSVGVTTSLTFTEIEAYSTAYNTTGKFTSKTLDLGITPVSLGTFNATETLNGETTSYFTQSSADGAAWDAELSVTNGGSIASTPKRYLRWGVNLTSDGSNTPQIDAAYLPAIYISAIHDTAGSIVSWGPFEADYSTLGQTINFYYRTATTFAGISSTAWNLIVPGGAISDSVSRQFVQFKIEISGGSASSLPTITSVTVNWVVGTSGQPQVLQNVASASWRNRYWLSAAGPSATTNDTILIRGKKTFQSPWMLKDWNILCFARFFDSLYGGSSTSGTIYKLDTGYSKAGSAMDSFFETGDFVFGGFTASFMEAVIEVERVGSWNLSFGYSVDGGNTWTENSIDLTLSDFDSNYIKRINMNATTTRIRFRFRTNGIDTPFQVHRCIVYYKMEVERGSIRGDYLPA